MFDTISNQTAWYADKSARLNSLRVDMKVEAHLIKNNPEAIALRRLKAQAIFEATVKAVVAINNLCASIMDANDVFKRLDYAIGGIKDAGINFNQKPFANSKRPHHLNGSYREYLLKVREKRNNNKNL